MSNSKFWSEINSIKVKWSKKNKISYSKGLLEAIFSEYGKIKHMEIFAEKRIAVVEYLTTAATDLAVKENKYSIKKNKSFAFYCNKVKKVLMKSKIII